MSKASVNGNNNNQEKKMLTKDIVHKTQFRNGMQKQTNAYKLAKMLSDKRRKGRPVSRQEIIEKLGIDPAPYVKMYDCFEAVDRGMYIYTGEALAEIA